MFGLITHSGGQNNTSVKLQHKGKAKLCKQPQSFDRNYFACAKGMKELSLVHSRNEVLHFFSFANSLLVCIALETWTQA